MPPIDTNGDETLSAEEQTLVREQTPAAPSSRHRAGSGDRFVPGTMVAGRYRIVTALGRGAMGEVYRADDLKLEVPVALKFLSEAVQADRERRAQLFAEIKVARQISHPNMCRVYDLGEAEGLYFLSMEYIDGEDLKSLLRRVDRPAWDKSIELGRQLCDGMAAAHEAGVLHRDLKPANLMIDGEGRARVTDFGLAAVAEGLTDSAGGLTGTPLYMAPEQFAGQHASVKSDLYAIGLVLYELLTGERVFDGTSLGEVRRLHQEAIPTPPSQLRFGFDPAVEEIILRCLAKDPADRPESVKEVSAVLEGRVGAGFTEGAQLATLVAADLVANAQLVESLGDSTSGELFQLHDRLVRDLVEENGGREIEKSDGFLLLFQRPLEALRFALSYHRELGELSKKKEVALAARVGIHLGEVVIRHNSPHDVERGAKPLEVEGFARPMIARLGSLAGACQTLLTQGAFDVARRSARGELDDADALRWLAHGEYAFDGVEESTPVFEVGLADFAPLTAPPGDAGATRIEAEGTILGWRPAPGLEVPQRPTWVVQKKLGEGGFGEAWLVGHDKSGETRVYKFCYEKEQLSSLQREITVFRLLKEELGLRDDIARILDWDLDEAPYFLEFTYIEGGSLVDWAQTRGGIDRVPLEERLELVAQAATALGAAHSVGVLHKDIKPANVLVKESEGGSSQAILTDFGIGLITEQERLAAKGITVLGMTQMEAESSGSPATGTQIYMAPELLAGQAATTQADIYSLGIMLYQMGVGDLGRPMAQGWKRHIDDELLREDIADLVDGNPDRRPGSAAEVATRIRGLEERRAARQAEEKRLLHAEKARRRRKVMTVAAAISTVFLVVVSILAIQAIQARADAERRRAQAEELIDFMLNDLHEGLEKIGRLDLLDEVARGSQAYFDTLTDRDETSEATYNRGLTLVNIGNVLLDQGDSGEAVLAYQSAVALFSGALAAEPAGEEWRRGLSLSRLRLARALATQGDTEGALAAGRAALEHAVELTGEDPDDPERRFAVARAHYQIALLERQIGETEAALGDCRAALQALEGTAPDAAPWRHSLLLLDTRTLLGGVLRYASAYEEALEVLERARGLAERLVERDPGNTLWQRRLVEILEEIGAVQFLQGDLDGAMRTHEAARVTFQGLAAIDPTRVRWRERLAGNSRLAGYIHGELGNSERALALYEESRRVLEELLEDDATNLTWVGDLASTHLIVGGLHLKTGRAADAVASIATAVELFERVIAVRGDDPDPRNLLSWSLVRLGDAYARRAEPGVARAQWTRAVEIIEPVTADSDLLVYLDTHAQALLRLGRLEEARPLVEDLLARGFNTSSFRGAVRDSGLEIALP